LWKQYAREFVGETETLVSPVLCDMRRWHQDPLYRAVIANRLSLPNIAEASDWHAAENLDANNPDLVAVQDDDALRLSDNIFGDKRRLEGNRQQTAASLFYQGTSRLRSGRFDAAVQSLKTSLRLDDVLSTKGNLARALTAARRFDEAEKLFETICLEDNPIAATDYAFCLAYQGKWRASLSYYEQRFDHFGPSEALVQTFGERWDGSESLDGRDVLVWMEQALGDQLQYARFLPLLQGRYPEGNITVAVHPSMRRFFEASMAVNVVEKWQAKRKDVWIPSMSLPYLLDLHSIPGPAGISFNETMPLEGDKKIGICWQGSFNHPDDDFRSMNVELLRPLAELPGVKLYNLQHDLSCDFAELVPINHFLDLARLVNSLDAVVSVDSAPAHLAGVLGKKCFLMLSWKADSRWSYQGERTDWYPTHELIRQDTMGDWAGVVATVIQLVNN
jgi:tetratricopeptide (TPR) repeat protein